MSLFEVISDFSLPTSIGHLTTPLQHPTRQGTLAQMVLWMLQHHLLMQLHTYVQFMPTDEGSNGFYDYSEHNEIDNADDDDVNNQSSVSQDDDLYVKKLFKRIFFIKLSTCRHAGSLLSMSSQPMPVPNTSRRSITDEHFSEMADSTISDNIGVKPLSPKSNYSSGSMSTENGNSLQDSLASIEDEEKIKELLMAFQEPERSAIKDLPAASNPEDLTLMVRLYQAGEFRSKNN